MNVYKRACILAVTLLLTGCGTNAPAAELTAPEKEFLKSVYMDEAQIDDSVLYSYQEDALTQYRYARQYLYEKYPNYGLNIIGGSLTSKLNTTAVFYFQDDRYDYELHVHREDDGSLTGEDNFYGSIIREAYDRYVYEECAGQIDGLVSVYSMITGVKGTSYDESLCVQDIITGDKPISPATEIYLDGNVIPENEWGETASLVEDVIKVSDLYGSYTVCYLADVPAEGLSSEECHDLMKNRKYLYKYSFQNF